METTDLTFDFCLMLISNSSETILIPASFVAEDLRSGVSITNYELPTIRLNCQEKKPTRFWYQDFDWIVYLTVITLSRAQSYHYCLSPYHRQYIMEDITILGRIWLSCSCIKLGFSYPDAQLRHWDLTSFQVMDGMWAEPLACLISALPYLMDKDLIKGRRDYRSQHNRDPPIR